jgi:toxin YoeB
MRLEFDPHALEDLHYWVAKDRKKALKVLNLIAEALRDPFSGAGKPEALKSNLTGCWSRRIDQTHRLVYKVERQVLVVLSCRYHYE